MDRDPILARFDRLNVWSRGEQRAPHKPLLVLYALGRWSRGEVADIPFENAVQDLTELLKEFGPPRHSHHPEYPFWRLQNDRVWRVRAQGEMRSRRGHTDPPRSELLSRGAQGGFSEEVKAAFVADPTLVTRVASRLLEHHFPETLHHDILSAVGLALEPESGKARRRDSHFRKRVLVAYEYRCAVCGLDVRIGTVSVALDAAHIRWHQAGGPDEEANGLALCVLHHKMFDLGAFTVDKERVMLVSDQAHGTTDFREALLRHHGNPVRPPQRPEWEPHPAYLDWHGREVFKGKGRHR